ncbi:MAG: thiolase family protein [Bacteroidota bacterium]
MKEVYIIDYQRTLVGKYGGILGSIRPDDLAAFVIAALLNRNGYLDVGNIDDVILGCANQAGEDNRNIARFAALLAGLPVEVPGVTVNRLCASGMQSVMDGFTRIKAGLADVIIAGGVESMSRAPYVMAKSNKAFERGLELADTTLGSRFVNKQLAEMYYPYAMGETAEIIADRWQISRVEQDAFAYASHMKYMKAFEEDKFKGEIMSLPSLAIDDSKPLDQGVRADTSIEKLAQLKPAFKEHGSVTAGNASSLNDGAAAMLLVSGEVVERYGLKPLAKIVSSSVVGVHPDIMGTGPVPATQKILKQTGLTIADIDLMEINEAYAVQVIYSMNELKIAPDKVNVNGGALAIGHPLGMSGTRITGHLALELKRTNKQYGIATMCVGVGQGTALLIENII